MHDQRESDTSCPTRPLSQPLSTSWDLRGLFVITAGERVGRVIPFPPQGQCVALGRSSECSERFQSPSISRVHARAICLGDQYVISDAGSSNGTFVNDRRIDCPTALQGGDQIRLGGDVILRFSLVDEHEQECLLLAAENNERDRLTGLFGRAYLEHALDAEIHNARRTGAPLSLMMIDLDRFKPVNDSYGHLAGDAVLAGLGRVMLGIVRNTDILARHGGDEFALVAPKTTLQEAHALGERLRCEVGATSVLWQADSIRVTASVGVASLACCSVEADRLSLLFLADQRTYLAKRTRNAVVSRGGCMAVFMPSGDDDATLTISGQKAASPE